MKVEVD